MLSVSGYRGIEVKEYDDENRRRSDEDLVGYRIVRPGQLVVNTMWLNYAGLGVSEHEGHVSPAYRAYNFAGELHGRFSHHLLRSAAYVQGYTQLLTGVRPNSLQMSRDDLMGFPILVPPREEQEAIAAFLDGETAKIDELVGEQQRLMELLKEKRQAVISHAVTKGLNPDAPMKPSGVEWLGEVPAHWKLDRLKRSTSGVKNGVWGDEPQEDTCDIPCVRVADFDRTRLEVVLNEPTIRNVPESDRVGRTLERGDLLLEKSGGGESQPVGCVVLYNDSLPAVCSNFVARVTLADGMNASFWRYTHAAAYAARVNTRSIKQTSGIQNLDAGQYLDERVGFPPSHEQEAISTFLDHETAEIDVLVAEQQRSMELLLERRSALISAAVTGQIDVRHLAQEAAA